MPSAPSPLGAWSVTDRPFIAGEVPKALQFGTYQFGRVDLLTASCAATLWVRKGLSEIMVLKRGEPVEAAKVVPNDLLEGRPAVEFLDTAYGLVAIGEGSVGLIEGSP